MKNYLLSIYQPDGPTPPPEVLTKVMQEVNALVAETKAAGVWVFNGDDGRFAGGVFTSREKAEPWIAANKLDGVLTLYPLDTGVYEWAIARGKFTPKQ